MSDYLELQFTSKDINTRTIDLQSPNISRFSQWYLQQPLRSSPTPSSKLLRRSHSSSNHPLNYNLYLHPRLLSCNLLVVSYSLQILALWSLFVGLSTTSRAMLLSLLHSGISGL